MPSGRKISATQKEKIIELYAKGFQVNMISNALELNPKTVRDLKNEPQFRKDLAEAINIRAESSNLKLHGLFRRALEECEGLLEDPNPGIRLGAARLVCESYSAIVRATEERELLTNMEARMEQLQASLQTAAPILEAEDAEFRSLPPAAQEA